jgi:subtilase family serine protease
MQRMLLVLKRSAEQDAALRKLLDDQQDKNSPQYHTWLTPEVFGREFGASDQDIQIVTG